MTFKAHPFDGALNPNGYYVVLRANIGEPGWTVRVLNFATWKHREFKYPDEATARTAFLLWTL